MIVKNVPNLAQQLVEAAIVRHIAYLERDRDPIRTTFEAVHSEFTETVKRNAIAAVRASVDQLVADLVHIITHNIDVEIEQMVVTASTITIAAHSQILDQPKKMYQVRGVIGVIMETPDFDEAMSYAAQVANHTAKETGGSVITHEHKFYVTKSTLDHAHRVYEVVVKP